MVACGIDFGTSNTTVALADTGPARLITLEGASKTLPSAVFWQSDAPPLFGRAAFDAYIGREEGRLMRGLKSTLGSSLIDERTQVEGRAVTFRQVLEQFFRHLKQKIDAEVPGLRRVVLGRPVHFVDNDLVADAAAELALAGLAKAAGFEEIAFQFEPIAAALHYEQSVNDEKLVLIVDVGGGTSDVSLVRVSPDRARAKDRSADILGNGGIRLGGTDFDRALSLAGVMPELGHGSTLNGGKSRVPNHYYLDLATWHRINSLYTPKKAIELKHLVADADRADLLGRLNHVIEERFGHALALEVEAAKIALSDAEAHRLMLRPFTGGPNPVVSRAQFDVLLEQGMTRIQDLILAVLAMGQVGVAAIDTVFMTGGSSTLPALNALVARLLPGVAIITGDRLGSVGAGLALEARRRFG
jgi:hypothetical chaperone protein